MGSGPLEIRAARGTVCYAISDSPPAPTERGFTLAAGKPKSIQATGQVWALTQSPLGATVLYQPSALKHRLLYGAGTISTPPALPVPAVITPPAILGFYCVGQTLSCSAGAWTNAPASFAYQWLRNLTPIAGANAATYVLTSADLGASITRRTTPGNASGSGASSTAFPTPAISAAPDIVVSLSGSDTAAGTLAAPVATFAKAQTLLRARIAANRNAACLILFRGGVYFQTIGKTQSYYGVTTGLTMTYADTPAAPGSVTVAPYPGEAVTISGGLPVTGWAVDSSTGFWTASLPAIAAGTQPIFNEMWVTNGSSTARSQWTIRPVMTSEYYHIASAQTATGTLTGSPPSYRGETLYASNFGDYGQGNKGTNRFGFNSGEIDPAAHNLASIRIRFERRQLSVVPLAAVDGVNNIATLSSHLLFTDDAQVNQPYRVCNAREALSLSVPGEMYLDAISGVLTYVPRPGDALGVTTFIAPVVDEIIRFSNAASDGDGSGNLVGNWIFSDINFAHTNSYTLRLGRLESDQGKFMGAVGAIAGIGADNVVFSGGSIRHTGESATAFGPGSKAISFIGGAQYFDLGANGPTVADELGMNPWFGGSSAPSTPTAWNDSDGNISSFLPGYNVVNNVVIHDTGINVTNSASIAFGRGGFNSIKKVTMYNAASFGIAFGIDRAPYLTNDTKQTNNYFGYILGYNFGMGGTTGAQDFGIFYLSGQQGSSVESTKTVIEYCWVRDIYASSWPTYDGTNYIARGNNNFKVYVDQVGRGVIVRNSVFSGVGNTFQIKGTLHEWTNNIAVGDYTGLIQNVQHYPMLPYVASPSTSGPVSISISESIFDFTPGDSTMLFYANLASYNMPSDNNLFFMRGATISRMSADMTKTQWLASGRDAHSIFDVDPRLNADFTFAAGNPLPGFIPIDVTAMGAA
ncbi:hypothetical protein [Methylocella tundrae]|uniref:hypothetical protein n=1 Tax=Methylocella tundrae TaxID=227605 RepID=UPI0030FE5D19|nr:hypothetical protein SIN04_06785 [Methylocella tundrae]